jgi:hypothetical protein
MTLPSQTERSNELGRSYVYKQRGVKPTSVPFIAGGIVVILAAGAAIWALASWSKSTGSTPPPGTGASEQTGAGAKGSLAGASTPSPNRKSDEPKPSPRPAPVSISQGRQPAPGAGDAPGASDGLKPAIPTPAPDPSPAPRTPEPAPTPGSATDPKTTPASEPSTPTTPPTIVPTQTSPASETGKPTPVDVSKPDPTPGPSAPTPGEGQSLVPGVKPEGTSLPPSGSTAEVRNLMSEGERKLAAGDLVNGRRLLSQAIMNSSIGRTDAATIRSSLTRANTELFFSTKVTPGDPIVEKYSVVSGDNPVKITRKRELAVESLLIQRINNIEPTKLKIGQELKLVRGPFHAIVSKSDYRLDLFWGAPDEPSGWLYIKSYTVGLGKGNSTPTGLYVVRRNSKLVNPAWENPQNGQKFGPDDPKNPIGERWIGLTGLQDAAPLTGYGIHGTIDPGSIGKQESMGCVRLGDADIEQLYELLMPEISRVRIVP